VRRFIQTFFFQRNNGFVTATFYKNGAQGNNSGAPTNNFSTTANKFGAPLTKQNEGKKLLLKIAIKTRNDMATRRFFEATKRFMAVTKYFPCPVFKAHLYC